MFNSQFLYNFFFPHNKFNTWSLDKTKKNLQQVNNLLYRYHKHMIQK